MVGENGIMQGSIDLLNQTRHLRGSPKRVQERYNRIENEQIVETLRATSP